MGFKKGNKLGSLNKGHPYYPASPEVRKAAGEKIALKNRGRKFTPEQREKYAAYWESKRGKSPSLENRLAVSAALKDKKKTPEHVAKVAAANRGRKHPSIQGEKHHNWKGNKASYDSLHDWVRRYAGNEKRCTACGMSDDSRFYHWANVSGEYKRELSDWIRLCVPCHSKLDKGRNDLEKHWVLIGQTFHRK